MKWFESEQGKAILLAGALLLPGALFSCTKSAPPVNSPEAALDHYVQTAFTAKSPADRQKLLDLSTGDAKTFLEQLSPEDFQKEFVENHMVFVGLHSKDLRREESGDVSLVYELEFKDGVVPNSAVYTNKKIAYLTRNDKGEWLIKGTKNIKSFIERKDPLEVFGTDSTQQKSAAPQK